MLIYPDRIVASECRHLDELEPFDNEALEVTLPLDRYLAWASSTTDAETPVDDRSRVRVGVRLSVEDDLERVRAVLADVDFVALAFEKFTDGRHFSTARLLRERYGYTGELRASGSVIRDQIAFLVRCGVDAVELAGDHAERVSEASALSALNEIEVRYQSTGGRGLSLRSQRGAL